MIFALFNVNMYSEMIILKIIYRQSPDNPDFFGTGIVNCYFKELSSEKDIATISKKDHHHTFFETHIIISGHQCYEIGNKNHKVKGGNLIIVPPKLRHTVTETAEDTKKISVAFSFQDNSPYFNVFKSAGKCIVSKIPAGIENCIKCVLEETKNRTNLSKIIIQNRTFEIIVALLRMCGLTEESHQTEVSGEDVRLSMAKQYIKDNIEFNPKLQEVAAYCYIGIKQLTRLFKFFENTTPALYIQNQKFKHIEKLLTQTDLSLKEISEKMNFSSEYHFNSFFKKIAGTPPGEYRAIMGK